MTQSRILIVDDEPNVTELVRLFLEKTKRFIVHGENHSTSALNTARRFRPDLIILDVHMPGKDGGDVLNELSTDLAFGHTPVLFLTGLVSQEETGDGGEIWGGVRYLAKPFNPATLVDAVERLLAVAA
jgi:DNA-binding response OmpR family regulator